MSPHASEEEKQVYAGLQNLARNVHNNEQAGIVLPSDTDPDTRQPLFSFDLVGNAGGKAYNTGALIDRWDKKILTALYADLRVLGQDGNGSFALSGAKDNIVAMALEFRLKEIKAVFDKDLIPSLFKANGWDDDILPEFEYSGFDDIDVAEFASAIQRLAATGMIEVDREVLNRVRKAIGVEPYPEDMPVQKDILSGQDSQSKSGKSFSSDTGGLNGTSNKVSSRDNSVANKANK